MTNEKDYPALYQSANSASILYQKCFYIALGANLLCIFSATFISFLNSSSSICASLEAILIVGALATSSYIGAYKPDKSWYEARAIAESVKTIAWRFVTKAEPFDGEHEVASKLFAGKLKAIIEQNRAVVQKYRVDGQAEQITPIMLSQREKGLSERKEYYLSNRIINQLAWYTCKAAFNKKKAFVYYLLLVIANSLALVAAILKIAFPDKAYWPTDIFLAIAACTLAWVQAKRFQDLASSYALAAHEISLIKEQIQYQRTDKDFTTFVSDAENAFSREHTQWVARKDT